MSKIPNPRDILVKPVISEKSYRLADDGKYTFIVAPGSSKTQIRQAVEAVFRVRVTGVNTVNRPGKRRRTRFGWGKRPDTKRAIVSLAEGERIDIFGGPVLASHHNCRALVPNQRQLTDAQIKRLVGRGAVIGTALDTWMLYPGWERGKTTPEEAGVKLKAMVDHIDRVCQLAGNAHHAAIGTDLDGGFGREQSPLDLDTIADLQRLPALLRRRGYEEAAVEGILFANWVRFFHEAWGGPSCPA